MRRKSSSKEALTVKCFFVLVCRERKIETGLRGGRLKKDTRLARRLRGRSRD